MWTKLVPILINFGKSVIECLQKRIKVTFLPPTPSCIVFSSFPPTSSSGPLASGSGGTEQSGESGQVSWLASLQYSCRSCWSNVFHTWVSVFGICTLYSVFHFIFPNFQLSAESSQEFLVAYTSAAVAASTVQRTPSLMPFSDPQIMQLHNL